MEVSSMSLSRFAVYREDTLLEGKIIFNDTSATFAPSFNFRPNTVYAVELSGSVSISSDQPAIFNKGIHLKWTFTTGNWPDYIMTRTSQHVTDFARDGSKMVQMGNYLYLYGGWNGTGSSISSFNDVYRSSGDLTTWEKLPDAPWLGRHTFGIGKINSTIYIYGGDQNSEFFDVWKSEDGEHFEQVVHDLDRSVKKRLLYGSCIHNNMLYVMGGQSSLDENSELTDIWTSPNGSAWRRLNNGLTFLGKNLAGSVASFNNKLWVVGGGYYRDPDPAVRWANHVYSSADGKTWTMEADAPWPGRQFTDVCVWDNRLWMIGGHNGQNLSDIWYMNKDGSWIEYKPSDLFTPRHASAVTVYNDKLIIACGDQSNECWVIEKPGNY